MIELSKFVILIANIVKNSINYSLINLVVDFSIDNFFSYSIMIFDAELWFGDKILNLKLH